MAIICINCGKENKDTGRFCNKCRISLPLEMETILRDRYKIINPIKAGGMGIVYKAKDMLTEKVCAIKEFVPPETTHEEQEQIKKRFEDEAQILARLNHTNLPKVFDYFSDKDNNKYYLAMDFIEGKDLKDILDTDGEDGLPEEAVIEWAKEILNILDYLHNQHPPIIYRDIKPANIMVNSDNKIFLVDFGIARACDDKTKTQVGTEGYAPKEQYQGKPEPRSDIYSLGATMHALLAGEEPEVAFYFEPIRKIKPSISVELEYIVMKALKEKLDERFINTREMLNALNNMKNKSDGHITLSNRVSGGNENIHDVVKNGDMEKLKLLLDKKDEPVDILDDIGRTPLYYGIKSNLKDIVELLLSKGADVNFKYNYGETPLHNVTDVKIAELLLQKGANVNSRDNNGRTPLHNVTDVKIAGLLLQKGADVNAGDNDGWTPLHNATDINIAKALLSGGADINKTSNDGWTPLHNAKDINIAELLLSKGADVNAKDNNNRTPLYYSITRNLKGIAELLIDRGADINHKDNSGKTPLAHAIKYNLTDMVKLFINRGADVNEKDNGGKTPLSHGIKYNSKEIVNMLLAGGAYVNTKDNGGKTPLSYAIKHNSKELVEILLEKWAYVNSKDNNGWTPLHFAAYNNSKELVELFILRGADINAKTNAGKTPLKFALEKGYNEIIDILIENDGSE